VKGAGFTGQPAGPGLPERDGVDQPSSQGVGERLVWSASLPAEVVPDLWWRLCGVTNHGPWVRGHDGYAVQFTNTKRRRGYSGSGMVRRRRRGGRG
jgi:hypothetical protein